MTHDASRHAPRDIPATSPYVTRKLRDLDQILVATLPRVQDGSDDEGIHDMRVAIRRLRTLLKIAREVYGRWHTDAVRRAFAEVMRATGDLRDEEVLEETLEGASAHPRFGAWLSGRKSREQKLRRALVVQIERGELDRARLMLKALLVFPVDPERDVELSRFARKTVERARRKVETMRDVEPSDVIGLHDLRIAYKELRYSIELLADALPIDARAQLEPATVFQKRLGEIHDVDVAIEVIRNSKTLVADAKEEALASLAAHRERRLHKYLRELDPLGHAKLPPKPEVNGAPGDGGDGGDGAADNDASAKAATEPDDDPDGTATTIPPEPSDEDVGA